MRYCLVSRNGIDFLIPCSKYDSWVDWLNNVDDSDHIPNWARRIEESS